MLKVLLSSFGLLLRRHKKVWKVFPTQFPRYILLPTIPPLPWLYLSLSPHPTLSAPITLSYLWKQISDRRSEREREKGLVLLACCPRGVFIDPKGDFGSSDSFLPYNYITFSWLAKSSDEWIIGIKDSGKVFRLILNSCCCYTKEGRILGWRV